MKASWIALAVLVVRCGDGGLAPSVGATPQEGSGQRPVRGLKQVARYDRLAVPMAFAHDGKRWIGAVDHELVIYDGACEVGRIPVMVGGTDSALAALPDGGWIAGARVLAADGTARFDGWSWAHRYGRFGSPKASAISPDGHVAIIDGADSPSTCLCDRERGTAGSRAGALVRLTFDSERPTERVLIEHAGRRFQSRPRRPSSLLSSCLEWLISISCGRSTSPKAAFDSMSCWHSGGEPLSRQERLFRKHVPVLY